MGNASKKFPDNRFPNGNTECESPQGEEKGLTRKFRRSFASSLVSLSNLRRRSSRNIAVESDAVFTSIPYMNIKFQSQEQKEEIKSERVKLAKWRELWIALSSIPTVESEFRQIYYNRHLISHPNVSSLLGFTAIGPIKYLVTEYSPLGSLRCLLSDNRIRFEWILIVKCFIEIALALRYLQQCGVHIRDLNPSNLLMISLDSETDCHCKLMDLMLNYTMSTYENHQCQYYDQVFFPRFTPGYIGPEDIPFFVTNSSNNTSGGMSCSSTTFHISKGYDSSCSVVSERTFGYGVSLYQMITRDLFPWRASPLQILALTRKGIRPNLPLWIPVKMHLLIEACWNPVETKRPSFPEILYELREIEPMCSLFPRLPTEYAFGEEEEYEERNLEKSFTSLKTLLPFAQSIWTKQKSPKGSQRSLYCMTEQIESLGDVKIFFHLYCVPYSLDKLRIHIRVDIKIEEVIVANRFFDFDELSSLPNVLQFSLDSYEIAQVMECSPWRDRFGSLFSLKIVLEDEMDESGGESQDQRRQLLQMIVRINEFSIEVDGSDGCRLRGLLEISHNLHFQCRTEPFGPIERNQQKAHEESEPFNREEVYLENSIHTRGRTGSELSLEEEPLSKIVTRFYQLNERLHQ